MKNKTVQLLCAWAVGLLMTGCGSEDEMPQRQDNADVVRIAASVGTTTRTLPDGATETEQQQFVNNDKIAVEATYNHQRHQRNQVGAVSVCRRAME